MDKEKNKKSKSSAIIHIATPFFVAAICVGITAVAMIKPADKLKVFANLAFMDSLKSGVSDETGLVIRESEIDTEHEGETYRDGEIIRPKFGELYAILRSEELGIDIPVYWGSNAELLEHGACHASSSVLAGQKGNSVISAHVDTYFADLDKLKKDDTVTLNTVYGEFIYKVREEIAFESSNRKYVSVSKDDRLTLYTCKNDILGASDQRIGFICDLEESHYYEPKKEADE